MRKMTGQKITGSLALGCMLFGGISAQAVDFYWTNADSDNDYLNTNNWAYLDTTVATNLPSVAGDVAIINSDGPDRLILTDSTPGNINSIHVGFAAGTSGEVEQNGGLAKATANSSRYSRIGFSAGATGLWTVNGGTAELNRCQVGGSGGVGTVVVNDGVFKVSRGANGYSLWLDITGDAGLSQGNFEISGGVLSTRVGVLINDYGTFTVKGGASSIEIGGAGTGQVLWNQNAGGTLALQVASNGLSTIEIDNDNVNESLTTFASGSILEPSFLGGYIETNAWVVMASEGSIADNGLTLAAGVDPNWAFGFAADPIAETDVLWIGYAGAVYEPPLVPVFTTNTFVDAIVDTPEIWNLFAPEGGTSALVDQSSSGFSVTVDTATNYLTRPTVAQEFGIDLDISEVGQSITINFDVETLDAVTVANGEDFRFAFYDTNQNYQIISGMIDFGAPGGTTMKMRMEEKVSRNIDGTETGVFVAGNYANLGNGSVTLGEQTGAPGNGIQNVGEVTHIETSITRTGSNEVSVVTAWSDNASTSTCTAVINEAAPADPAGMPVNGEYEVFNGFGFKIFADAPYSPSSDGRYKVSNYEVSYTQAIPLGFSYSISGVVVESSGDITLTLSDPVVGAVYIAQGTTDLINVDMAEIGSYLCEAPGTITIPAADAAPFLTGVGFFDVALPVYEVVE